MTESHKSELLHVTAPAMLHNFERSMRPSALRRSRSPIAGLILFHGNPGKNSQSGLVSLGISQFSTGWPKVKTGKNQHRGDCQRNHARNESCLVVGGRLKQIEHHILLETETGQTRDLC